MLDGLVLFTVRPSRTTLARTGGKAYRRVMVREARAGSGGMAGAGAGGLQTVSG